MRAPFSMIVLCSLASFTPGTPGRATCGGCVGSGGAGSASGGGGMVSLSVMMEPGGCKPFSTVDPPQTTCKQSKACKATISRNWTT